ncbi:MAG: hypothetical protein IJ040_02945 [Lachnospiraceae bacterium]|nr:hypothetical protein [Lachnospiraceae bacterium]
MLKNKNVKIIIGAVIALCVLVAASIWASMSLKSNSVDDFNYQMLAESSDGASTMTQIDHIIENSNAADTDASDEYDTSNYYFYIIVPNDAGKTAVMTDLNAFIADGGFKDYIVNDYRTIPETMPEGKVIPVVKTVGELNASADVATEIGKADLIYVYAASNAAYSGGNAISEDLYKALHNYAFGSLKPLIMNYGLTNSGSSPDVEDPIVTGSDSQMFFMTTQDFKNSWKRTKTTNISAWDKNTADAAAAISTIETYISSPRSTYTTYQANRLTIPTGYESWADYWKRTGTADPTLNVLYIYGDNASAVISVSDMHDLANWMVNSNGGQDSVFGASSADQDLPTVAIADTLQADALTVNHLYAEVNGVKVKKYDYIFIAPDTYANHDISTEVRTELNKLSEDTNGLTYILFGTLEGATTSGGGNSGGGTAGGETLVIDTTTNFGKLIDLSITTNGYSKKNNILVVGFDYMKTMAGNPDKNPKKISSIVTLINKSTYRGYAGSGAGGGSGSVSTTAYRVLELQPCYPIDKELAANQTGFNTSLSKYTGSDGNYYPEKPLGNYYTIPSNVLNTSEIDNYSTYDENTDTMVMDAEYYKWDLSKAKISYALNMQADQIELVQMSTDEYITAKADVTDSFDLIYIGGNMSAFKNNLAYGYSPSYYSTAEWCKYETVFSMYTHTGEMTAIAGQRLLSNNPYTYTVMNGNDITYDRLTQLQGYIDAGMPIVFSNEIWQAYEAAVADGYKNRYMDPDCNMFKLCAYAESKDAGLVDDSILLNWNNRKPYAGGGNANFYADYYVANEEEVIDNPTGFYGSSSKVTIYSDTLSNQLMNCVYSNDTSVRPKFVIDTTAIPYVEGDSKTELEERSVTWTVKLLNPIDGHSYEAILLEDTDDNAVFTLGSGPMDKGEQVTSANFSGDTASLAYTYPSDEFGAFSWKIVVRDITNQAAGSYTAITCFKKLEDQPKKQASVLEIMPMTQANCQSTNPTSPDGHTFYLDKNYQQSSGNPYLYSSYGTAKADEYGYCPIVHSPDAYGSDALNFNSNLIAKASKDGNYQGLSDVNMGKYMTTLSVNRYDSAAGHEDRDYNYMDLVSDEFDFSLDIMYMDDIEFYANAARNTTEEEQAAYLTKAEEAYALYEAYITPGTIEYNQLKAAEDNMRNALISIRDGNGYTADYEVIDWQGNSSKITMSYPTSDYKTYGIDNMLQSRDYFRFFYLNTSVYHGDNYCQAAALVYFGAYKPYIEVHDEMVEAYRAYRHYSMMAYGPEEYLRKNYDVIVVGFLDDYNGNFTDFSQNATDDLLAFTNYVDEEGDANGGSLLMTHDNMTYSYDASHAVTLTATMRNVMGMSGYSQLTRTAGTENNSLSKYSSTDADRYFLTNMSSDANYDLSMRSTNSGATWNTTANEWMSKAGKGSGKAFNLQGYTDVFNVYETNTGRTLRYTYAEFQIEESIKYNMQVTGPLLVTGTAKATQVNRGVVTTYPFYIASDLRISNTHSQAFALDLEDEDVTVWYTLAADAGGEAGTSGGTNYTVMKENSSFYAATPKDGVDNYYIYSVGNITYCGAGHALITGDERDNNDERRLFLNVLVNMAQKTGKSNKKAEDIVLFDPDGTTPAPGEVVKRNAEHGYYIDVNSGVDYPEFGFGIQKNNSQSVTNVQVFYDLDYDASKTDEENDMYVSEGIGADKHILIPTTDDVLQILNEGGVYLINRETCPGLITQRSYFEPYGGQYTYLVVRVTLTEGDKNTVITKRIKVVLTRELLNLT